MVENRDMKGEMSECGCGCGGVGGGGGGRGYLRLCFLVCQSWWWWWYGVI